MFLNAQRRSPIIGQGLLLMTLATATALLAVALAPLSAALLNLVFVLICATIAIASFQRPKALHLLSPVGLAFCFLVVTVGVVPVIWALELAEPWREVQANTFSAVALTSISFGFFTAGIVLAQPKARPVELAFLQTRRSNLNVLLLLSAVIGVIGYLALAMQAGGPTALLYTLGDRRVLLAGTGPLKSIILVSAVGCVLGVLHEQRSQFASFMIWVNGAIFMGATLLTGSRFGALALLISLAFANAHRSGQARVVWRWACALILLVVPLSTLYGYLVRTQLTYGVRVDFYNGSSVRTAVASYLNPFVQGGLDSIRTTGVLSGQLKQWTFDPSYVGGSIANIVPRAIWSDKPPGSATHFSEAYFSQVWAQGTGVPPSIFAECLVTFGLIGGLGAAAIVGFFVSRLSTWMMCRHSVFWMLLTPLMAANAVSLAKGGSDSFIRTTALNIVAVGLVVGMARLAHTRVVDSEPNAVVQNGPGHGAKLSAR